ncbi:MAG: hypothetical protein MJ152_02690, partial [Clostridia bacterium]|nr:hypothetical protein [Clostridia bacterium]
GYVEARYVPLEYDIVFINATTGPSPVKAHYNCVTEMLQYEGQAAQKVDSLPKPTHVEHYKNEKWLCLFGQEPDVREDFPINEDYEGFRTTDGILKLELQLQADYEKEDCYVSFVFKDTDGNLVESLTFEECIIEYKAFMGNDEIPVAESYKYDEAVISLWVDFAEIDAKGYNFIGIFAGDTKIGVSNRLEKYPITETVEIIIKVEPKPAQD